MTVDTLDFEGLYQVLDNWPTAPLPARGSDGLFERISQILDQSKAGGLETSLADLAPLLKHVLRRQSHRSGAPARLRVPVASPWPSTAGWALYGVSAHSQTGGHVLIEAQPWRPAWLSEIDTPVFEDVFAQSTVRKDWAVPMDPFLAEPSGYETYVSPGQREAVRSAFLLPQGETLIVCLPTGSGKSLVAQAPVLARGYEGGLSLCIVPTTALALDQARQTARIMAGRTARAERRNLAWHKGLSLEDKAEIKSAIREGRQGILYCSPEAMTGALLPSLYSAAQAGLIDYLIIDEAHLLSQWGDGFRPAFQLVAGVRRGLLRECPNAGFRTILMSATLTTEAIETIDALFGPPDTIQMLASIHIRPEPQYWIQREDDEATKHAKIIEAVRNAPRPVILYTTKRDDARDWCRRLKGKGFRRVETFHGETADADRERIIRQWANNEIDIIVATSAFGVGIDKGDVRTVIHAAVPETVDRFYQEVGRGGRDGAPSGSLLLYSGQDIAVAERIGTPSLISEDLAFERWEAMAREATHLDQVGMRLELNLATVPPRLRQQTEYNAAWNMRTLIMMARAGMLEMDASAPEQLLQGATEGEHAFETRSDAYWADYYMRGIVDMQEPAHRDKAVFVNRIQAERSRSFMAANANAELLTALVDGKSEVGALLQRLYQSYAPDRAVVVSKSCGGCPVHRREGAVDLDYSEPVVFGIGRIPHQDLSAWTQGFAHLSTSRIVFLVLPDPMDMKVVASVLQDAVSLFNVREIALSRRARASALGLRSLHRRTPDRFLMIQDLEDEAGFPTRYPVARISVLANGAVPPHLLDLERPLHIVIAPASTPDPWHPHRRIGEVGANILTLEQFRSGSRQ
ncbi:MAG: ATP-dependent DNA helicase RecQ [Alphaproteobacteria bacterium]|nr:MAG: ATP-dependent DNA helicase RecQ [Alphaproteobacteria bacterium]